MDLDVGRMRRSEQHDAVVAVARAFHRDPVFDFIVPDALSQARAALRFVGSIVADGMPFGETWAARAGGALVGACVWLPPGAYPRGWRREALSLARDLPAMHRVGGRMATSIRLYAAIDRMHRAFDQPHWYLGIVGTDPGWQRRGVGTALVVPILERADEEGVPAYLETQKPENLPWYRRLGFDDVSEIDVPGAPRMWTMRRFPR